MMIHSGSCAARERSLVRTILLATLTASSLALAGAAEAQTIENGSFELGGPPVPEIGFVTVAAGQAGPTGWTIAAGSIDISDSRLWDASDADRSLDMGGLGAGTIWQDVATEAGEEYTLLFDLATNPQGSLVKEIEVSAASSIRSYLVDRRGKSFRNMGWRTRYFTFVADSTTTRIQFRQVEETGVGAALDNVRFGMRAEDMPPTLFESFGPLGGNPTIGENAEVFFTHTFSTPNAQVRGTTLRWQGPGVNLGEHPDYPNFLYSQSLNEFGHLATTLADLDGDGHLSPVTAIAQGSGGSVYLSVGEGVLIELFLPDSLHPDGNPIPQGSRSDRVLHLATGQLDEDEKDEVVLALWASDETIRIYVIDDEALTLQAPGSPLTIMDSAKLLITEAPLNELFPRSAVFSLAVGDFDGDTQDEIAIVYPDADTFKAAGSGEQFGQNLGLQDMRVDLFEYEPEGFTDSEVVGNPLYERRVGGIEPAGGGQYPALICDGSLTPCGTNSGDKSRTFLNNVMARSANLTPSISSLLGFPSEHLVVATQTGQWNQCASGCRNNFHRPAYLSLLRFTRSCGAGGALTEDLCIESLPTHTPLVRVFGATEPRGLLDTGTIHWRSSAMCFDAGNLDSASAADYVVVLNDVHLSVFHYVGGALELFAPTGAGDGGNLRLGGAYRTHQAGNHWGSQCSLAVADLNAGDAAAWSPEVVISYQTVWRQDRSFPNDDNTWYRSAEFVYAPDLNPDGSLVQGGQKLVYLGASDEREYDFGSGGYYPMLPRAIAVGDRDNNRVRLGKPVHLRRQFTVPQVIINSPPVHLEPGASGPPFDLNDCFQSQCWNPVARTGFAAGYEFDVQQQSTVGTTYKSSWQLSAKLETESSATIDIFSASVKQKFETSYGQNFERSENQSDGFRSRQSIFKSSNTGDTVKALVTAYDVWEYPVLANFEALDPQFDETDATVLVVVPDRSSLTTIPLFLRPGEVDSPFFWMTHEAGNLMSYKTPDYFLERSCGQGASEPDCAAGVVSRVYTSFAPTDRRQISASDGAGRSELTLTSGASSFQQSGSIFSFNHSTTVGGGVDIGIAKSSASLTIGSKYSTESISTQTTAISEAETLWTQARFLSNANNTSRYSIVPFLLMHNGAFVLDYGVDFDTNLADPDVDLPPGSIFAPYKLQPDLAVRLPYRRDELKGLPLDYPLLAQRTPEILVLPLSHPDDPDNLNPVLEPGAIVEIQTRVHNYSLTPTIGGERLVISYDTPVAAGVIESQLLTSIEAQGTSDVITVEWQIPDVPMEEFDQMRLLVEVDPDELVAEVHEDNNWGWRPLTADYVAPVPEPAAPLMACTALAAIAALRRRKLTGSRANPSAHRAATGSRETAMPQPKREKRDLAYTAAP